jgi:TP901 family phage tail tape measure protein
MIGGLNSLGLRTHQVGLEQSIASTVKKINRAGVVVRVKASDFTQPLGRMSAKADEFTKSLEASNARVIAFGASAAIIGGVTTAFSQLVIQATKVEKILADINAVLGTSAENLEKFGDGLFNVARNTSQGLEVAAEAALEFSRQGLSMEETLKRTNDALILTRLTGLAAADSVKGLTAAVNGFADAGLSTTEIINKLAAVDVKFAVSADDLINALARAGAVAQDAGVDFDKLVGAVTSAQQITARGGAVIGNSFKTIFTRLQRSSTLDRLEELGIAVRDLQGETLPALTILQELSKSYDTLGAATKAAVAEQVGGVFQINILKAALKDLSKENSLYAQATETSASASNEAYEKNALLQKTLSSIATQTLTTVKELTANLGELTIAPALKTFLDNINGALQVMSDLFGADKGESIGSDFAQGLAKAVGGVLSGPGMFGLVMIFGKLFGQAFKFAKNSVKDLLQIKSIKDQELAIQESIVDAMLSNVELQKTLLRLDGDQLKQEQMVLGVLQDQTNLLEKQRNIASKIAPGLRQAGVQPNLIVDASKNQGATSRTTKSSGHIPTPMEEMKERAGAKQGGYIAGPVATMSIPKLGRVVYNKNETVKQFEGMSQPAIMPPEKSKAGKEYKNDFSTQHGFDPYSHDSFSAGGFIPNYSFPTMNQNRLRDSRSRNRGVKNLNLEYFYPAAGQGGGTIFKMYKDIVRSADSGQPYTNILAGEIIGPRIPKMIVEGKKMLDKARLSGKKIPKMSIQGTIFPSMLTRKIDKFASDRKDGYIHPPIDYIPGEESEVRKYLKSLGADPESHDTVKLQNVYKSGYNTGFIPSFALKAGLIPGTNILRLPTAKMINETTASDFKGNKIKGWQTLEATVDNVQKHAQTYRNELSELKKVGVGVLQRKMYFSNQSQHIPVKDRKNIARQQKKMKSMKGFAGRNQHKITGNSQEDALFKSSLKDKGYYPTWTGAYTSKGRQEGKGDENFKVDFFAPGRKPIESKYGKYTAPNLIAKSIRLYSDSYIEEFLSRSGRSDLSENMRKGKLKDSTNMLTSLGYKDVNADTVLRAGLFNGYLPDRKNTVQQNLRTVKELEDRETVSSYSAMSSSEMFDNFSSNSDRDFPVLEKMSKDGILYNKNKKSRKKDSNYNLEPEGFYHEGIVPNFSRNWAQGKSKSSDKNQGRKISPQSEVIKAIRATLSKRGIKRSAMAEDKILFAAEKYMSATKSRDYPGGYVNINGNKINLNEITLALKKHGDYHPSFQDTVEFDGSQNHQDNLMFEESEQKHLPNYARYGMSSFRSPIMFKTGSEGSFGRSYLATTSKSGKLFLLKDGYQPFSEYMKKMGKPQPQLKEGSIGGREGYWVNDGVEDAKTWAELPNTKLLASQEKRRAESEARENDRKARLNPGVFDPVLSNGKIFFSDGSSGSVDPDSLSKEMGKEYKHVEVDKRALHNYAKENKITKKIGGTESVHLGNAFNKILSLPRNEFLKMKHIIRPRMQTDREKDAERKMNAPSRPIKWDVRDNQKGKKQFNLKADDRTFRQFATFLLDQGVPKRSVDNIHKALANKQAHLDKIVKEARDKRSMGRGRGVFFDAAKKQENFEKGFSIPTDGLFIKNLNQMVRDFNKTVYNSDGFIPNFANRVYDRDKIQPGVAGDILNKILSNRKKKNLLLGPSGVGKTTMAAKYGSFIQNLEDAQAASSYTILSGASKTKSGGVSPALQNIINAVNQSGGKVSYLSASDEVIDERRNKRIEKPVKGDLRSTNQLKGTRYAPKNQPDFIDTVRKISSRFEKISAFDGLIPNFVIGNIPTDMLQSFSPENKLQASNKDQSKKSLKVSDYKKALKDFLDLQVEKNPKEDAWTQTDFDAFVNSNKAQYPSLGKSGHHFNLQGYKQKGKPTAIYTILQKEAPSLLNRFKTGIGGDHSQAKGQKYENLIEEHFGVKSEGHNAPIDYKGLGSRVQKFKRSKDHKRASGELIVEPQYTLLADTSSDSPIEAAANTGHTKEHMGRKGVRFAAQNSTGRANIKKAIVSAIKNGAQTSTRILTGKKQIVELIQSGKQETGDLTGIDPNLKAFSVISKPSDTPKNKKDKIIGSLRKRQTKDEARNQRRAQQPFNINLFTGSFKSGQLEGHQNIELLEEQIEKEIEKTYNNLKTKGEKQRFTKGLSQAGQSNFSVLYNKDVLDLSTYPGRNTGKSLGFIPNFSAWNPVTKNTQSIAKQGGLATSKFGLAKIIQNSPFKDLLRKHNHWNNFPEKHKKRLNQWLRSQGYTNRALQGWGLLSKHSKSIATGISDLAVHHGHIPNFSNPLTEAISREKHALREQGSSADIYIDQDNRLKNPKNPAGLLVANTRDEPKSGSQGVNRAISMGIDPKTHGASSGVVPNFNKTFSYGNQGGVGPAGKPGSSNQSNKDTKDTSKAMKETGDASNDLMMKMMALTTVTYALDGAMGQATEEASNFQKGISVANSAIMGMSQAAMLMAVMPKKFMPSLTDSKGKNNMLGNAVEKGKSAASKVTGKLGGSNAMKSLGGLAKGLGGLFASALGPIGIAVSVLIPVISALTENFDMFKSATELATRDLENLQKGLSRLENASSAAASLRDTSSKIYELEQKGSSRSISQQKEYYKLKNDEMKQQNKLNSAINQVVISHSSQNETGQQSEKIQQLLNGSYEQQIAILDQMQVVQQQLINQATNRKNLAESLESAGAGDFGAKLADYTPELRMGARNTLSGFNTDFSKLNSSDIKALESSIENLRAGLSGGEEGDDRDEYNRRDAEVIVRALTKGQDISPDDFSNQVDQLINTFVTATKSADTSGITLDETFQKAGKLFLSEIGKGARSAFDAAQSGNKKSKGGPDLEFGKNLRMQGNEFLKEQTFLLAREIQLMENRLDLQEKMISLEKKRMGFFDVELPDMFGLLTKDEKIDRETAIDQKSLMDNLKIDQSKIELNTNSEVNKILSELMQPDDFAQALFDKEKGFRTDHLNLLKNIVAANDNSEDKKEFQKEKEKKLDIAKKEHQSQTQYITDEANDMNMLSALLGQGSFGQMEGMTEIKAEKGKRYLKGNVYTGVRDGRFTESKLNKLLDSNEKALKESLKKAGVSEAAIESQLGRLRKSIDDQKDTAFKKGGNFKTILDAASKQTYAGDQLKGIQASKKNVENIRNTKFVPKTQDDSHVQAFFSNKKSQSSDTPKAREQRTGVAETKMEETTTSLRNTENAIKDKESEEIKETKQEEAKALSDSKISTQPTDNKESSVRQRTENFVNQQAKIEAFKGNLEQTTQSNAEIGEVVSSSGTLNPPPAVDALQQYSSSLTTQLPPKQAPTIGFNQIDEQFESGAKLSEAERNEQAGQLVSQFEKGIESLLSQSDVKDSEGKSQQALGKDEFAGLLKRLTGAVDVSAEVKITAMEQLAKSGLISNLEAEHKKALDDAKTKVQQGRDEIEHAENKAKIDSESLNLDNLRKKISERTNQGADAARLFLNEYADVQGDLLKSERDRFESISKWGDIDTELADLALENTKILQSTGEIYKAQRKAAEATLTTQLKSNIIEIENQKAINDSKDGTQKGLELTEQSFSLESEKLRATQIDLNNKLKLPNLSAKLLEQAKQETDIKTKQLSLDNKLLAEKIKLYATSQELTKQVQAELTNQRSQSYIAGQTSDEKFRQNQQVISDPNDPYFGRNMTGFQADATERQANLGRSQRDQLAAARADFQLYTGQGNDLRASDARLQMLQIQKQKNIEEGNSSLFSDTIAVRIAEANAEMERFGETLGNITFDSVQQGLKDVVTAMADGTKSMKDALMGFVGGIATAVSNALLERATKQVTSAVFGMLGMDDMVEGKYNGGLIRGYASGGSTNNKAPAMLTAGEYVVRKKVVDRLGTSSLDKMNKSGKIDDSLESLYSKPNEDSFDISTEGSASVPPIMRFNEGGKLNAIISNITSPIAKLFGGGNPFSNNADDSNAMKFAKGAGYLSGSALANYEDRDRSSSDSGPVAPVDPGKTRLNTASSLDIDPTSRMMSARFRKQDSYSRQYGDYLLAKYDHDIQKQNAKVMENASVLQGIAGNVAGSLAAVGISRGLNAVKALATTTNNFTQWDQNQQAANLQHHFYKKGINSGESWSASGDATFEAARGGFNAMKGSSLNKSQFATGLDKNLIMNNAAAPTAEMIEKSQNFRTTPSNVRSNSNAFPSMPKSAASDEMNEIMALRAEVDSMKFQQDKGNNMMYTRSQNFNVSPRQFDYLTPQMPKGQDARIKKGFSSGGKVYGPSGRDQVGPVMLDRGEYVIRASSVDNIEKKYPGFFDKLNSMKFNEGGLVDPAPKTETTKSEAPSSSGGNVTVNINVSGGQASTEGGGASDQAFASRIKDAVVGVISQEKRVGGMLNG